MADIPPHPAGARVDYDGFYDWFPRYFPSSSNVEQAPTGNSTQVQLTFLSNLEWIRTGWTIPPQGQQRLYATFAGGYPMQMGSVSDTGRGYMRGDLESAGPLYGVNVTPSSALAMVRTSVNGSSQWAGANYGLSDVDDWTGIEVNADNIEIDSVRITVNAPFSAVVAGSPLVPGAWYLLENLKRRWFSEQTLPALKQAMTLLPWLNSVVAYKDSVNGAYWASYMAYLHNQDAHFTGFTATQVNAVAGAPVVTPAYTVWSEMLPTLPPVWVNAEVAPINELDIEMMQASFFIQSDYPTDAAVASDGTPKPLAPSALTISNYAACEGWIRNAVGALGGAPAISRPAALGVLRALAAGRPPLPDAYDLADLVSYATSLESFVLARAGKLDGTESGVNDFFALMCGAWLHGVIYRSIPPGTATTLLTPSPVLGTELDARPLSIFRWRVAALKLIQGSQLAISAIEDNIKGLPCSKIVDVREETDDYAAFVFTAFYTALFMMQELYPEWRDWQPMRIGTAGAYFRSGTEELRQVFNVTFGDVARWKTTDTLWLSEVAQHALYLILQPSLGLSADPNLLYRLESSAESVDLACGIPPIILA